MTSPPLAASPAYSLVASGTSAQGNRPHNEDHYVIWQGIHDAAGHLSICAVLDGHSGTVCATLCRRNLVPILLAHPDWKQQPAPVADIVTVTVAKLDEMCLRESRRRNTWDGTTLCAVLCTRDGLFSVNVGDCRAVASIPAGNAPERLTRDQKVNVPEELARLQKVGAPIQHNRLLGVHKTLDVSRALGDRDFKDQKSSLAHALVSTPEVRRHEWTEMDGSGGLILLATDGLWDIDFLGDSELVTFAMAQLRDGASLKEAASATVQEGLRYRNRDNSTLVVIRVRGLEAGSETECEAGLNTEQGVEIEAENGPKVKGTVCEYWEASEVEGKRFINKRTRSLLTDAFGKLRGSKREGQSSLRRCFQ